MNCPTQAITNTNITCNVTTITMGRNATIVISFDDGSASLKLLINNSTISFEKMYKRSGNYKTIVLLLVKSLSVSSTVAILPSQIFKLKCDDYVQVGEVVNCSIIVVMSNANVNIFVDFGDGEQRLLYLANSDIALQKIYAQEANFTIIVQTIDKYFNKTMDNQTVQVKGGIT